jgi:hypothetical protein
MTFRVTHTPREGTAIVVAFAECGLCGWSVSRPTISEAWAAGSVHAIGHRSRGVPVALPVRPIVWSAASDEPAAPVVPLRTRRAEADVDRWWAERRRAGARR